MLIPERVGPYLAYPHADIDCSHAPIYLTLPRRRTDYESYLGALEIARAWWPMLDHPVAWITDTRDRPGTLDARTRGAYAQFLKDTKIYQDRYLVCSAIIAVDAVQRGIPTAIRWQSQQECPQQFFEDLPSAMAWCKTMLVPRSGR